MKLIIMKKARLIAAFSFACVFYHGSAAAQPDTLRVMAYNVLGYGQFSECQGPHSIYNAYLDTIVQFANPDIIGLEKMGSVQTSPTDFNYDAPIGFQDSILQNVLNPAFPGRFNFCQNTNYSASNTECLVFYNQQKLGYLGITCTYVSGSPNEDFNTQKFYYLDPNLSTTHDTTFLYLTDTHDISGSTDATERGAQIAAEMIDMKNHFTHLANMINMGDFNLRNTSEPLYQTLTNPADTDFRYYDPPFVPDALYTYPADWDDNPGSTAAFLTTSTRVSATVPNACGTSGGGKDWFDHIFLSPWIINNANYISYVPHSCRVLGNDGHRVGVSINAPANSSAPASVINSLYQMSNKYPILVDLLMWPNTTGTSLPDPEILPSSVAGISENNGKITVVNPMTDKMILSCSSQFTGRHLSLQCVDMLGRTRMCETFIVSSSLVTIPCNLEPGVYSLRIADENTIVYRGMISIFQ